MLAHGSKCSSCVSYRDHSLRSIYHRWVKQGSQSPSCRVSSTSRANIRYLNTPERVKRYSKLRTRLATQNKVVQRLKEKIALIMDRNHVVLDSTLEADFKTMMNDVTDKVRQDYSEQSFKRIFWEQQLQIIRNAKNSRQIRWHPAMIKFCLHLKFISSGAYHALRSGGIVTLPSERTLRDYTNWMSSGIGFLPQVDAHLAKEANITEEKDRYIVLIWDEMKIKNDLIFNKHTCELVGFANIGDVNSQLDKIEQLYREGSVSAHRKVATHILLFYVRGLLSDFEYPYAHFSTTGVTADYLYPIVWEAVQHLEYCGFNVVAFCCDGASPNRKFYNMHRTAAVSKGVVYKTENPFCIGRAIYFICDVPHLMKTTRNCWSNSLANSGSRALWVSKHVCHNYACTL